MYCLLLPERFLGGVEGLKRCSSMATVGLKKCREWKRFGFLYVVLLGGVTYFGRSLGVDTARTA